MRKVIEFSIFDVSSIEKAIKETKKQKEIIREKCGIFAKKLAEAGYEAAKINFSYAEYDGTNDVSVSVKRRGDYTYAVVATGKTVLFIEFGSGISFPDDHPKASELGFKHGDYGQKKGRNPSWAYYGEPGTNGSIIKETEKGTLVRTKGNPANMSLFKSINEIEKMISKIAKEVFL